jgi:DNA polymerase III epsilon subunit-like protein
MQLNKLNNIIFLKDVESNIIEEAFVVLKNNIEIKEIDAKSTEKNKLQEINILKEAELLINKEIEEKNIKYEKFKIKKLEKKIKFLKIVNIFTILGLLILVKIF